MTEPSAYPDLTDAPPMIHGRPVHPVANLFPLMTGADFDALVADIQAHGVREPGRLDKNGNILDGRNRARACAQLGIEMPWITGAGADLDPVVFIASLNLHRRHLNESQRAIIAAKLATMKNGDNQHTKGSSGEPPSVSTARAAATMKVGPATVKRAKLVLVHGTKEEQASVETG